MDAMTDFDVDVSEEDDGQPLTMDMDIDVVFQKKRFTVLHLEEPTGEAMERATLELNTREPNAYTMTRYKTTLIAQVARVPREVVLKLRQSQIDRAYDFLDELRAASLKDGAT